jgi:predicted RNA-binding protein
MSKILSESVKFSERPEISENPMESLHKIITSSSKDWSEKATDAWIYGIVVGWSFESYQELMDDFKWDNFTVNRNKRLHQKFIDAWNNFTE